MSGSLAGTQVDTSMYSRLLPQQQSNPLSNPLGMANQAAELQTRSLANQATQQQLAARQAMGPILQESVGPDGQIDYNKAAVLMAAHPETAWMAGDFAQQAITRQKMQADTALTQFETAQKQYTGVGNAAASLIPLGNSITRGDVISGVAGLVGQGLMTKDKALQYVQGLPPDGAPLAQHVKQMALYAQGAAESIKTLSGTITHQNLGGRDVATHDVPFTGQSTPVNSLGMTPTPSEYFAPKEQVDDSGAKTLVPAGPGLGMPAPGSSAPGEPSGGIGGAGQRPGAGDIAPVQAAPGIQTALSAGFGKYQAGEGPVVDYEKDLNQRAQASTQAIQMFNQVSKLYGQFVSGAGAEVRQSMANLARSAGLNGISDALAGGDVSAAQEFMKYSLRQSMAALMGDLNHSGRPTGGEWQKYASEGSPNISMTPEAIQHLNAFMQKLAEQNIQEQQWFNKYKGNTAADGTMQYSNRFKSNPQGFQQLWVKNMQDNGTIKTLDQLGKQAFQPSGQ